VAWTAGDQDRQPSVLAVYLPLLVLADPSIHIFADLILAQAVTLLDFALQLFALSTDRCQIVVGELAPLFFGFSSQLLPIAGNPIPIHEDLHVSSTATQDCLAGTDSLGLDAVRAETRNLLRRRQAPCGSGLGWISTRFFA